MGKCLVLEKVEGMEIQSVEESGMKLEIPMVELMAYR